MDPYTRHQQAQALCECLVLVLQRGPLAVMCALLCGILIIGLRLDWDASAACGHGLNLYSIWVVVSLVAIPSVVDGKCRATGDCWGTCGPLFNVEPATTTLALVVYGFVLGASGAVSLALHGHNGCNVYHGMLWWTVVVYTAAWLAATLGLVVTSHRITRREAHACDHDVATVRHVFERASQQVPGPASGPVTVPPPRTCELETSRLESFPTIDTRNLVETDAAGGTPVNQLQPCRKPYTDAPMASNGLFPHGMFGTPSPTSTPSTTAAASSSAV